ncbi:MAG: hypothetical protein P4L41_01835 [Flavipsychrobacter sp.]|nr:hypothetical protein [Flavipsychrobacter sp.]
MRIQFRAATVLLFSIFLFISTQSSAKNKKDRTGSIYFSWGYNTEWYTKSTVTINQPGLGNNYQMVHVNAHDHRGWDEGLFHKAFTIPQYNYRLGYYFNKKQDLGIEINFDHTKYLIADGQQVHLKGTLANKSVDEQINFAESNGFYYFLNNGANFLLFNLVKRVPVYNAKTRNLKIDLTGKAGIGPVIPHVQNDLFGHINAQQFQLGGWNTGAETAVRVTVMKYAYLEFSQKVDYARYSHLLVYDGRAKQNFGTYELILSLGFIIPTTKHNPSFTPVSSTPTESIK